MTTLKIPKNVDVDRLCNLAATGSATREDALAVHYLRKQLKAVLTAYRKTLKPKRRT